MDRKIPVTAINSTAFTPYGTFLEAIPGDTPFGELDASLQLQGTPRFYIMRLSRRPSEISQITRHQQVTQALASADHQPWIIVVAEPSDKARPDLATLQAFRVPAGCAIVLHRGTWHAGPYFDQEQANFFNLELSDTNISDHQSWQLEDELGFIPELLPGT